MKWLGPSLLFLSLVFTQALAEFSFTVEATDNGVPIPQSEIKLEPLEPTIGGIIGNSSKPSAPSKVRRTNAVAWSSNWCGSVGHTTSTNQIKIVHGIFQHPGCTKRTGATYPQAAASWVGIDGNTHTSALFQAGTVCKFDTSTSSVVNQAWWQWVPNGAYTITSMPVAAGDQFEVTINTTSTTAGKVTITNVNQGISYSTTITGGATLARVDADWVIERPVYGSSLAGFARFSDTWFQSAYAKLSNNANLGILGTTQYQISGGCGSQEYDDSSLETWSA
ncbi:concanavalin A-like lectin/glucanase domain-containing protein [Apodospora peruviana]|uniref:Concanavalin A-like lectin/glucanase domain-containing protein n=1 Tax=Apodospora peruviana TaxID=516989 RepID=A0AAE0I110_9PEZI|nr:concanavalin A-like lectin/glucanase domain-containing protein [Apodospora peruviana]